MAEFEPVLAINFVVRILMIYNRNGFFCFTLHKGRRLLENASFHTCLSVAVPKQTVILWYLPWQHLETLLAETTLIPDTSLCEDNLA